MNQLMSNNACKVTSGESIWTNIDPRWISSEVRPSTSRLATIPVAIPVHAKISCARPPAWSAIDVQRFLSVQEVFNTWNWLCIVACGMITSASGITQTILKWPKEIVITGSIVARTGWPPPLPHLS
jgi:hypothetical protein